MQIEVFGYTALGDRRENEDTGTFEKISDHSLCALVCDGLGGHGGGRAASETAVGALLQCRQCTQLPTKEQILGWMNQANGEILAKRDGPRHMKTTAVFLFIQNDQAIWAHIGDSRLYHFHNGNLVHYTNDHSVCQIAVKLGEITRRDIPNHPDRSKVLKVLGADSIAPEIHDPIRLEPGEHAFLLCTDGLWERLLEDEIQLDLLGAASPEQWLYSLRCRAERRKSRDVDNNTAVAVFIKE